MDELLARIAADAGISQATAERAVGHILAYIKAEGSGAEVGRMIDATPGAKEAMAGAGEDDGGGMFGGGIMALGSKLMGLGLDMGQIRTIAEELVAFARAHAGESTVDKAIASVPGLSQFV